MANADSTNNKVAIITGGASGMGLAVAETLASRGGWDLHLFDLNEPAGQTALSSLQPKNPTTYFHKVNVTDYTSLSTAFRSAFLTNNRRRLDFVFANAGIAERPTSTIYKDWTRSSSSSDPTKTEDDVPPPPPPSHQLLVSSILFDSIITTTYLSLHYFRLTPSSLSPKPDKSIVITASCGGLYPSNYSPVYSAAKHGNIGFVRCVAKPFYLFEGIRVNCICPGTVRTSLLNSEEWNQFPEEYFTPVEKIASTVVMLVDGVDETDKEGRRRIDAGAKGSTDWKGGKGNEKKLVGETVEICGENHYYREGNDWCDERMEGIMKATDITNLSEEQYRRYIWEQTLV